MLTARLKGILGKSVCSVLTLISTLLSFLSLLILKKESFKEGLVVFSLIIFLVFQAPHFYCVVSTLIFLVSDL